MTLLTDTDVLAIPLAESDEPLVEIDTGLGTRVLVRQGVAGRVQHARSLLVGRFRLVVVDGHRAAERQARLERDYLTLLAARYPELSVSGLRRLADRHVPPPGIAPHVAGAAVDVTITDARGWQLDFGTPVDATPEDSDCRCYFHAECVSRRARANRRMLAGIMGEAGFINYPTGWWRWSYGDRYWARVTGAEAAIYGPVEAVAPDELLSACAV